MFFIYFTEDTDKVYRSAKEIIEKLKHDSKDNKLILSSN